MKSSRIPSVGWASDRDPIGAACRILDSAESTRKETESISGPAGTRDKIKRDVRRNRDAHDAGRGHTGRQLLDQMEQLAQRFDKGDRLRSERRNQDEYPSEFAEPTLSSEQVPENPIGEDSLFEETITANRRNANAHSTRERVAPRSAFDSAASDDAIYKAAMRSATRGYGRDSAAAAVSVHREVARDMSYLATPLSPHLARTPEGFLVAQAVPFARTGFQTYKAGELADPDNLLGDRGPDEDVEVWRDPSEVFSPQCMSSWEGKPVTLGHPSDLLDPDSAQRHAIGHVQNIRKGSEPLGAGLPLLGDLVITDATAIQAVEGGLREVSGGYTYKLAKSGGRLEQKNIWGNHIAIVSSGRAGSEARINDAAPRSRRPRESHIERETRENDQIYSAVMKASRR